MTFIGGKFSNWSVRDTLEKKLIRVNVLRIKKIQLSVYYQQNFVFRFTPTLMKIRIKFATYLQQKVQIWCKLLSNSKVGIVYN